jgi:superfamily I DNA/RNA helicase
MKLDVSSNQVKLMPLESSKGLEFRVVFLLGIDSMPRIKRDEISERAFTYVGMTRAQDYLYIYFHDENIFIKEIEEAINHIKKINEDILKLPIKIT